MEENEWDKKGRNIKTHSIYDEDGYDIFGWNAEEINKETHEKYDKDGFDMLGYDRDGFDRDGLNENGFNRNGYFRNTSKYKVSFRYIITSITFNSDTIHNWYMNFWNNIIVLYYLYSSIMTSTVHILASYIFITKGNKK